jgi:hypothetical protein
MYTCNLLAQVRCSWTTCHGRICQMQTVEYKECCKRGILTFYTKSTYIILVDQLRYTLLIQ